MIVSMRSFYGFFAGFLVNLLLVGILQSDNVSISPELESVVGNAGVWLIISTLPSAFFGVALVNYIFCHKEYTRSRRFIDAFCFRNSIVHKHLERLAIDVLRAHEERTILQLEGLSMFISKEYVSKENVDRQFNDQMGIAQSDFLRKLNKFEKDYDIAKKIEGKLGYKLKPRDWKAWLPEEEEKAS